MFIEQKTNDDFANMILDALCNREQIQRNRIAYHDGDAIKQLSLSTMLIEEEDLRIGICVTISEAD